MSEKGILISARPENAIAMFNHLRHFKELLRCLPVNINKTKFVFPLKALVHVKGDQVRYKLIIVSVKSFESSDFQDSTKKPEEWRIEWRNKPRDYKSTLTINSVEKFDYDTHELVKINGEKVKNAPQLYTDIFLPQ